LGSVRGWRTGAIVALDGNILLGRVKDPSGLDLFKRAEELEIMIALEAMHSLALADGTPSVK